MIKTTKKEYTKGFTIIELVVVLSIFAIISSVSIFNYNGYRSRILRVNTAQDIALSVRQAQVYGLAASGGNLGDADFDVSDNADVFFGTTVANIITDRSIRGASIDPASKTIILFEDINRNLKYNNSSDRIIDQRTVTSSKIYMKVCLFGALEPVTLSTCLTEANSEVNITFARPYPDAAIEYSNIFYSTAVVHILDIETSEVSATDVAIQIDPAGQIFVHNT